MRKLEVRGWRFEAKKRSVRLEVGGKRMTFDRIRPEDRG